MRHALEATKNKALLADTLSSFQQTLAAVAGMVAAATPIRAGERPLLGDASPLQPARHRSLDHLIVGRNGHASLKSLGLMMAGPN